MKLAVMKVAAPAEGRPGGTVKPDSLARSEYNWARHDCISIAFLYWISCCECIVWRSSFTQEDSATVAFFGVVVLISSPSSVYSGSPIC